jgi:hypothetical protein
VPGCLLQSFVLFRLAYLSSTDSWRLAGEEMRGRSDAVDQDLPSTWDAQWPLVKQLLWGLVWPPKASARLLLQLSSGRLRGVARHQQAGCWRAARDSRPRPPLGIRHQQRLLDARDGGEGGWLVSRGRAC